MPVEIGQIYLTDVGNLFQVKAIEEHPRVIVQRIGYMDRAGRFVAIRPDEYCFHVETFTLQSFKLVQIHCNDPKHSEPCPFPCPECLTGCEPQSFEVHR